ncbi:hypothetical protein B484DRAFT_407639 [Ochromonadaceae sp. CCMP2298]|nr:hypothetical protein B484DRAFT_407639 [Ochromonadaceae sp. CCMP2298]
MNTPPSTMDPLSRMSRPDHSISKEGPISKQNPHMALSWQKRYLVLFSSGTLAYYGDVSTQI